MYELYLYQNQLIRSTSFLFRRDLIDAIAWDERLIGLIGARGVGKTTIMLQHLMENTKSPEETLYVTIDNVASPVNSLFSLAEKFFHTGGKQLYLDEIHKYPNWAIELKNIYDLLPALKVVFSGSSILKILGGQTDLSRRAVIYHTTGLSFREFLQIKLSTELPAYSLDEILTNHEHIANELVRQFRPLQYFSTYLKTGYYPFFLQSENTYELKLLSTINFILEGEISGILKSDLKTIQKFKHLLHIIAANVPYQPNITKLAESLELNRNTLLSYLSLLDTSEITHSLYGSGSFYGKLSKPQKILLFHPNLAFCLSPGAQNSGSIRESFVVNQLRKQYKVELSGKADFFIHDKYTLEIGGKNKTTRQISGIPDSYVVADDLETGYYKTIPMWLLGFLY